MTNTKQQVREFYDEIGWKQEADGLFQNARYEDLRPVAAEYVHNCHLRVNHHLASCGDFLLDAGSGPVQYDEYLTFSEGYRCRVCADISITALQEARKRVGKRGLYVVADISNLPFKANTFDGEVSMHTIHHLPMSEHRRAYTELVRVLKPDRTAVVINGWDNPLLMRLAAPLMNLVRKLEGHTPKRKKDWSAMDDPEGTFVKKMTPHWLKQELIDVCAFDIFCWRSLSTNFTKTFVRPKFGGKAFLKLVYWLEERFPRFFGENGQYPMIVIRKS